MSLRRIASIVSALLLTIFAVALVNAQPFDSQLYAEMRWRMIGPFRAGRTVTCTGVPYQPNVFYVGTANGGVWKTSDYGRVWRPVFDGQSVGSVGAVAVAPTNANIVYAGCGEGMQRPDLAIGNGVYKSTDAGETWRHMGLSDAHQIAHIVIDPKDANRLWVAVMGHPYGANAERGVFRSTDGGANWQKVLYRDENAGASDIALDPTNANTLYASLFVTRRPPWTTGGPYVLPGGSLHKSTDGGTTWQRLTQGLPADDDVVGRITLAVAPSNPHRLYARVDARRKGAGLYRSDDAGTNWQLVNSDARITGRGDDLNGIAVFPSDENTVLIASIVCWKSTDGGKSISPLKGAPGGDDYVRIWINPDNPQIIALAVDQGATITVNGGETWSSWYNQATAAFYRVSTDNRFPYWVYGGQQDSGSMGVASRSDYGAITWRDWYTVGVEEYGAVAPDPLNPDIVYGGKVTRFDHRTKDVQNVSPLALGRGEHRFNRTAPLVFSQADKRALYFASQYLFKTTNGGKSWDTISPDLTRKDPPAPPNLGAFVEADPQKGKHRGVIYAIAPSPIDANLIWAGTDCGLLHVTQDGGQTWKDVTPPDFGPWSRVFTIEASRFDRGTAYVAMNRFRLDDWQPYIYRTRDFGKTWQKITSGIPATDSSNSVREDPERKGLLYAATEFSIYVSFDDGEHWQSLQLNLPHISMRDIVVHKDDLVVGTHGRSFWILDDLTPLRQISEQVAASDAYLFKPQEAIRFRRSRNTDTPIPPDEAMGKNPPDGAIINYYLKAAEADPVTLEIFDSAGKLVRSYSSADALPRPDANPAIPAYWVRPFQPLSGQAGMHRFVWDLRRPAIRSAGGEFGGGYPISAIPNDTPRGPQGPLVAPGFYSVKLTVKGRSFTQPLTVRMDPRAKTPLTQFALTAALYQAMQQSSEALEQVRRLRAQVKELQPRAAALTDALHALDRKAAEFEGGARGGQGFGGGSSDVANNFAQLITQLNTLINTVDSTDELATAQVTSAASKARRAATALLARWQTLKGTDVIALNEQLKRANLPPIQ